LAAQKGKTQVSVKLRRVLVVDDDRDLRFLLSSLLGSEGYEVIAASEGGEALARLRQEHPDVILLDLKMPGLDGVKTLERLRQSRCRTPVILLTAHSDLLSPVQAARLGAYDFITKPFNNDDLLMTIGRALEREDLTRTIEQLSGSLEDQTYNKKLLVDEWFDCEEGSWD
jgi:two-component system response regulator AtoC